MNIKPFIENFDILADAPNGVEKLRKTILQLAVQGNLVPQDPKDESASILFKKLEVERKRVINSAKYSKSSSLPPLEQNEIPWEIPQNWKWIRLAEVGQIIGGGTPRTNDPEHFTEDGIAWITPADLYCLKGKYIRKGRRDITQKGLNNSSAQLMPAGAVLFSSRAPIGYVAIAANAIATNQGFKSCVPFMMDMNEYIYYFLLFSGEEIDKQAPGTTFKEVSGKRVSQVLLPLPPLQEQKRIVAKVDQLMALCNELEEQKKKRSQSQLKLHDALLDKLLSARDPKEFAQCWQRICDSFDLLYDRPETVQKLRQAILQLAVQGKLVPQNPNDEPASVLLRKMQAEKQRLIKEGKIKKSKPLPAIKKEEYPYTSAKGWAWVRLDHIMAFMDAGWSPACNDRPVEEDNAWGVLKTTAVQPLEFCWKQNKALLAHSKPRPEYEVKAEDILVTRAGPKNRVGICCIVKSSRPRLMISDKIIRFNLVGKHILPEFLALSLNAGASKAFIETQKSGMAESQMNISQLKLKTTPIPIPPTKEQKRIVAKVDQLRALCDELETKLRKSHSESEKLMEAVMHQMLRTDR